MGSGPEGRARAVARACAGAALAALAERELHLVRTEAYDELAAVHEQRLTLLEILEDSDGGRLDETTKAELQTAMRAQLLAAEAMRQRRDGLAAKLQHNGRARRAAAGYAAAAHR